MNDKWIMARLMKNNNTSVFRGDNVYASIGTLFSHFYILNHSIV